MVHDVMLLVLTALMSSVITLSLAYLISRLYLQPRFERQLQQIQAEFEARVKAGVRNAGDELLPDFRQQVKLGFTDALSESHTAGLVEETAKVMSVGKDLGAGIVETGLNALFGRGKPPKR
jgi:GTP cyclohydrolase III